MNPSQISWSTHLKSYISYNRHICHILFILSRINSTNRRKILDSTNMRKLLGSTTVSTDNKVTIVKKVTEILKIERGDILAFYEESGRVYIEKG